MRITTIKSHVLQYELDEPLGYSQQYFTKRTAHLVEVSTDEGITGWGECFGAGPVALANRTIVEAVIQPMIIGRDPFDREAIWHHVYNMLRDHGQKGMPIQALSGVDIALWDIAGKALGQPLWRLLGGRCRDRIPVYGYGMMLQPVADLEARFAAEAASIEAMGFAAMKMKVGHGVKADIGLVEAVRGAIRAETRLMVDANHCYTTADAFAVGRALEDLDVFWFEEPVAPEDRDGYRRLRDGLRLNIAGGEAEFSRYGWRDLLASGCLDIAQPEVCGLGGISEFQKVMALCQSHFVPVVNHVWGSSIAVAVNLHLLTAQPPMPGGLHPFEPMLEFDTTPNRFRDDLATEPLDIQAQVRANNGTAAAPERPGIGVEPDPALLRHYAVG